jgi:hypothetical protein
MPGQLQTLNVPPPVSIQTLWNAIRVAFVNRNHPGAISYNPLTVPPPNVSVQTLIYAALKAAQGELQS